MFRPNRRKKREISTEAAKALLKNSRIGVLAVNGDDGYPYAIPVNYVYVEEDEKIYFHGSKVGHKIDSIRKDSKVCFTVYGDEVIKDLEWAPYVRSAVVFGKCILTEGLEKNVSLVRKLAEKYYPNTELIDEEIASDGKVVQMFEIEIEHLTGKEIQER